MVEVVRRPRRAGPEWCGHRQGVVTSAPGLAGRRPVPKLICEGSVEKGTGAGVYC